MSGLFAKTKEHFWKPIAHEGDMRRFGALDLSRSPWVESGENQTATAEEDDGKADTEISESNNNEPGLPTKPEEDAWSDLMLELTLAAAYANIMANTPAETATTIWSFLSFFALVWWIWASQVVYNVRFRTRDFLHRFFAIAQFLILGTMATFTSNFNIFAGLIHEESDNTPDPVDFTIGNGTFGSIFASSLRQHRLPVINARGIAIVVACSRLLLLVEYGVAYYHCIKHRESWIRRYSKGLLIHIVTLTTSMVFYFVSYGIIGHNPNTARNVLKILFWFLPMIGEIASYFVINRMTALHVSYRHGPLADRARTLLVVVVGEGLNQITGVFKYVVGAVGFSSRGVGTMISAAIIIICILIMYRRNMWETWTGDNRTLLWFFTHYVYLATVILTLQGVKYLLWFGNLYASIIDLLGLANKIGEVYRNGATSVSVDMFPEAHRAFDALGLPWNDFIDVVNVAFKGGYYNFGTATKLAQTLIYVAGVTFNQFDAFPKEGSDLYNEVEDFLKAEIVHPQATFDILGKMLSSRLDSAFWFWGVAGGSLIMLSVLSLLKQWPVDKYDTLCLLSRVIFGLLYLLFSALTAGRGQPYFTNAATATDNLHKAKPWAVASSGMVVASFALVLILVVISEMMITYIARRASKSVDVERDTLVVTSEKKN